MRHTCITLNRDAGVPRDLIRSITGHEVETIVNTAKAGDFDLLVVGYHGHSAIFGRIMGSTAQSIVRLSPCPVLLAK